MSETDPPTRGTGTHSTDSLAADTTTQDNSNKLRWKDTLLGNARSGMVSNVSWGSIFAGIVTFLAIVLLFGLLTASLGLDGSGTGAAIVSVIGLLLGLFVGGAVAGTLAVRSGFLHGFLTWAGSLVAAVVLAVILTTSAVGALGGFLGNVSQGLGAAAGDVQLEDVPNMTPEQLEQAEQAAQDAAEATQRGATYGFWGLLLGSLAGSLGGVVGSRSVAGRRAERSDA